MLVWQQKSLTVHNQDNRLPWVPCRQLCHCRLCPPLEVVQTLTATLFLNAKSIVRSALLLCCRTAADFTGIGTLTGRDVSLLRERSIWNA